MTNREKQADEILVLQSIFDKKFRLLDENRYEIAIEFELLTPITLQFDHQSSIIQYLPPFTLIIHYHDDYPSIEPPSFILSCFYFSKYHLQKLCQKLDNYPFQGEVCVYDWIDLIKHEINDPLILEMNYSEQENDPRALNGYSNETVGKIFQYLINYNQEYADRQFKNRLQTCFICTEFIPGSDCIRLHRCGHFYCRFCLNNYIQMTFNNGQFGEKLHCPQNQCKQPLLPTEVRQILQNDQLYERYERLTLQRSLELMNDITWCPRCQSAVLMENNNDNLAICSQCRYTFCCKCKEVFHSQTMCPKDYIIEQLRLQQEKERARIQKEREEALAKIAKVEKEKKTLAERNAVKETYRRIVISLSEQDELLEEVLNAERIETLNTQYCPKCHVRIEKNGGCSHMHCSQCDYDFTWQEIATPANSKPTLLNDQNADFESVKEELSREIDIVKVPQAEADQDEDMKISIDNRSIVGSAIVKRVRRCPSSFCKKINVKADLDNWIVCSGCTQSSSHFFPPACLPSTHIGSSCNISNLPCDILKPCQNNGTCINNNITLLGYICSCLSGFNGTQCQFDNRPCQLNTCWNNGICSETSNTTFKCQCASGWQDDHCQTKINYCDNGTCLNEGVCQSLLLNYTCLCLGNSYSGRYCENKANKILLLQIISKSFAYIAIIAIISVGIFVVTMDVLKYFFGIDPVGPTSKQIQAKKRRKPKRKKKPVTIKRFIYVNAPSAEPILTGEQAASA